MLNISGLENGVVLDHIPAGKSMDLYHYLNLDKLDCQVAVIKNADSKKMGRKDIIKISGEHTRLDFNAIAFLGRNITVNIIINGRVAEKRPLKLPGTLRNIIKCKNPRCITSIEQELPHIFFLSDPDKAIYRCRYCEEKYS